MSTPLHIFILAAGFGTRLKPLSERLPKPLVPVCDLTALEHQLRAIDALREEFAIASINLNAHHLYPQVEQAAQSIAGAQVWVEWPDILGTGAPVQRLWASGLRGDLLVLNADNFHNFDLGAFVRAARQSQRDFALLGVDFAPINSLSVNAQGLLNGVRGAFEPSGAVAQNLTFSGIAWYSAAAWSSVQSTDFSIVNYWKRAVLQGQAPWVYPAPAAAVWIDMGTPLGLFRACKARLAELGTEHYVAPDASVQIEQLRGAVVVSAGVKVPENVILENVVLLPGASVAPGADLRHCIVGADFIWPLEL